jgi:hypothetical protein
MYEVGLWKTRGLLLEGRFGLSKRVRQQLIRIWLYERGLLDVDRSHSLEHISENISNLVILVVLLQHVCLASCIVYRSIVREPNVISKSSVRINSSVSAAFDILCVFPSRERHLCEHYVQCQARNRTFVNHLLSSSARSEQWRGLVLNVICFLVSDFARSISATLLAV